MRESIGYLLRFIKLKYQKIRINRLRRHNADLLRKKYSDEIQASIAYMNQPIRWI